MALGLTMVVYFVIRMLSMDAVYHAPISLDYWITAVFELMMPLEALREYVLIALLPFDRISIFYPLAGFDLGAAARLPLNMLSLLTVCMVVYLGFWRLRLWALMLIAALISISLVIHLIPMTTEDGCWRDFSSLVVGGCIGQLHNHSYVEQFIVALDMGP